MAEDTTRPGPLPIISIRGCRQLRPANHAIPETIEQGFKAHDSRLRETNSFDRGSEVIFPVESKSVYYRQTKNTGLDSLLETAEKEP